MILSALNGRKIKSLKEYVEDGDQFLFMWLCKQYKKVCRILPRMWNVSGCSKPLPFLGLTARGKQANGTCWKIVHFNCLGHVRGRLGEYRIPKEWREATRWAKGMKYNQLHPKKDWRTWKDVSDSVSNRSVSNRIAALGAEATSPKKTHWWLESEWERSEVMILTIMPKVNEKAGAMMVPLVMMMMCDE